MARSRNIKPGFFTNDALGELPPLARLLFAGLWTVCDRAGRCEDRPKKIRAEVLPYDDCDIDGLLVQLMAAGFIDRYEVAGRRVIQVVTWDKHQNPHCKEAPSILPARCEPGASPVPEQGGAQPQPERAGLIPSLLIPDSLFLDSLSQDAAPAAETATSISCSVRPDDPDGSPSAADELFTRFWDAYPRKVGKPNAQKAFKRVRVDEDLLAVMVAAIEAQGLAKRCQMGEQHFVPYPATWLNDRRWQDDPAGVVVLGKQSALEARNAAVAAALNAEGTGRAPKTFDHIDYTAEA